MDLTFLHTLITTGVLTAGVSLTVFLVTLQTETLAMARTHAFATLVFAELFRSFGCRSETKPIWRLRRRSNWALLTVVTISFSLQLLSHHYLFLGRILQTSPMDIGECLLILVVSLVPMLVLEAIKTCKSNKS